MIVTDQVDMVKKHVDVNGVLTEPVTLKAGSYELPFLTRFKNLVLEDDTEVSMLNLIDNMGDLNVGVNCKLAGLVKVETLDGLRANNGLTVSGLSSLQEFGRPVLATNCSFSWVENLVAIDFDAVMWPKKSVLYGLPDELEERIPQWLSDSKRLTIKR
jgi:hypothetical protein